MNVLLCGKSFPEAGRRLERHLARAGHRLLVCDTTEIVDRLGDADVIIPIIFPVDDQILSQGRFGLVQQYGVGLDTVDIGAATRHGVWVARIPSSFSGNAPSVAEHAMLLMLTLSRRMAETQRSLQARRVGEPSGLALLGKTACIVGMGNIGAAVAVRLDACGMRLLAVDDHDDPTRRLPSGVRIERFFPMSGMAEAMAQADYVVVCINYHAGNHDLFNRDSLAAVKTGAFLINVARGGLVNPDALLDALRSGRLAGAGLDVCWEEPVDPTHPIFEQNVIVTPHIAGVTDASYEGIALACVDNIVRFGRGEAPQYAANAPASPRWKPAC